MAGAASGTAGGVAGTRSRASWGRALEPGMARAASPQPEARRMRASAALERVPATPPAPEKGLSRPPRHFARCAARCKRRSLSAGPGREEVWLLGNHPVSLPDDPDTSSWVRFGIGLRTAIRRQRQGKDHASIRDESVVRVPPRVRRRGGITAEFRDSGVRAHHPPGPEDPQRTEWRVRRSGHSRNRRDAHAGRMQPTTPNPDHGWAAGDSQYLAGMEKTVRLRIVLELLRVCLFR